MMTTGAEKITGRIMAQAEAQAQEIIEAARRQADEAIQSAVSKANEQAGQIIQKAQRDAKESGIRTMAVADLSLRKQLLATKRTVLNEAFLKAGEAFMAMDDAKFASIYAILVLEAIQRGDEGISPAKADEKRLGESFMALVNESLKKKGLPTGVKMLPARNSIAGGCVLISGDMEIDLSVQSVLASVRERTEGEVAALLFAFMEG